RGCQGEAAPQRHQCRCAHLRARSRRRHRAAARFPRLGGRRRGASRRRSRRLVGAAAGAQHGDAGGTAAGDPDDNPARLPRAPLRRGIRALDAQPARPDVASGHVRDTLAGAPLTGEIMAGMTVSLGWGEIATRLALTVLVGMLVGYNRSEHGKAAGMRTTLLVCLAASVAMIEVNLLLPTAGRPPGSFVMNDLMRLPLGILTGVGFI